MSNLSKDPTNTLAPHFQIGDALIMWLLRCQSDDDHAVGDLVEATDRGVFLTAKKGYSFTPWTSIQFLCSEGDDKEATYEGDEEDEN